MASYDRVIKYLVEKFEAALAPLGTITKNQEVIIVQNKQLIDLLQRIYTEQEVAIDQEAVLESRPEEEIEVVDDNNENEAEPSPIQEEQ